MKDQRNKETILIVDDEPGNRKILMEILGKEYKITAAANGEQALKRIDKGNIPDLVLLDIMMPGIDGYEVCRQLKQKELSKNIPVIFITALNDVEDETTGFAVGAVDYITKPFHPPVVIARVNTQIALKRKTDLLEKLVSLDGLTEIPNRRRFDEVLEKEWKRARRTQSNLSFILMDIDYFKKYNDNYGHSKGDICLRSVAQAMNKAKRRPGDFVARYGGEEFAFILPDTDKKGAFTVAESIRSAVEQLNISREYSEISNSITISLGTVTMTPQDDWQKLSLINYADKALYKAKNNGRNQVISL